MISSNNRRFQVHTILRHPDRIQADDVVDHLLVDVRYATGIVREVLGHKSNGEIKKRMCKMGLIGGEGRFRVDDEHYEDVIFVGDLKPKSESLEASTLANHGVVSPMGMIFRNRLYLEAESKSKTLLLLSNTCGGEAGTNAALNGQSWLVSANIYTLLSLNAPIISIVLGEGGSGGALSGQVADINMMMRYASYSVISPEQGAWILRGSQNRKDVPISDQELSQTLDILKPTAQDLYEMGVVDKIITEYEGGAHLERNSGYRVTLNDINAALKEAFQELRKKGAKPVMLQKKRIERALKHGKLLKYSTIRRMARRISELRPISKKTPRQKVSVPPQDELFVLAYEHHKHILDTWGISSDEGIKCEGRIFYPPMNDSLPYREEICGAILSEKEFQENFKSCPRCGWGERLSHSDWIHALTDQNSFMEFDSDLKYEDFEPSLYTTDEYLADLQKARRRTGLTSGAVTGRTRVNGHKVIFYLLDFGFMGGTLGITEGEKFCRAVQKARTSRIPLVGVFSSGGVRMAEGTLGLKQMEKTIAAAIRLRDARVPFYSILVSPCTGGVISSNASIANHIISERYGIFSFAGPGVVRSAGGEIDDYAMCPTILCRIHVPIGIRKGKQTIDKILFRKDMKAALFDYVQEYYWLIGK